MEDVIAMFEKAIKDPNCALPVSRKSETVGPETIQVKKAAAQEYMIRKVHIEDKPQLVLIEDRMVFGEYSFMRLEHTSSEVLNLVRARASLLKTDPNARNHPLVAPLCTDDTSKIYWKDMSDYCQGPTMSRKLAGFREGSIEDVRAEIKGATEQYLEKHFDQWDVAMRALAVHYRKPEEFFKRHAIKVTETEVRARFREVGHGFWTPTGVKTNLSADTWLWPRHCAFEKVCVEKMRDWATDHSICQEDPYLAEFWSQTIEDAVTAQDKLFWEAAVWLYRFEWMREYIAVLQGIAKDKLEDVRGVVTSLTEILETDPSARTNPFFTKLRPPDDPFWTPAVDHVQRLKFTNLRELHEFLEDLDRQATTFQTKLDEYLEHLAREKTSELPRSLDHRMELTRNELYGCLLDSKKAERRSAQTVLSAAVIHLYYIRWTKEVKRMLNARKAYLHFCESVKVDIAKDETIHSRLVTSEFLPFSKQLAKQWKHKDVTSYVNRDLRGDLLTIQNIDKQTVRFEEQSKRLHEEFRSKLDKLIECTTLVRREPQEPASWRDVQTHDAHGIYLARACGFYAYHVDWTGRYLKLLASIRESKEFDE